jgi:hypothetical protein
MAQALWKGSTIEDDAAYDPPPVTAFVRVRGFPRRPREARLAARQGMRPTSVQTKVESAELAIGRQALHTPCTENTWKKHSIRPIRSVVEQFSFCRTDLKKMWYSPAPEGHIQHYNVDRVAVYGARSRANPIGRVLMLRKAGRDDTIDIREQLYVKRPGRAVVCRPWSKTLSLPLISAKSH